MVSIRIGQNYRNSKMIEPPEILTIEQDDEEFSEKSPIFNYLDTPERGGGADKSEGGYLKLNKKEKVTRGDIYNRLRVKNTNKKINTRRKNKKMNTKKNK